MLVNIRSLRSKMWFSQSVSTTLATATDCKNPCRQRGNLGALVPGQAKPGGAPDNLDAAMPASPEAAHSAEMHAVVPPGDTEASAAAAPAEGSPDSSQALSHAAAAAPPSDAAQV